MKQVKSLLLTLVFLLITCLSLMATGSQELKSDEAKSQWDGQTVNVLFLAAAGVTDFENLIPAFEEKYGVKVNLELASPSGYAQKGSLELSSNKGAYDVVWNTWGTYHQWVDAGWFEPLDKYLNDSELVEEDQLGFKGFAEPAVEALQVDGKQYGLPIMSEVMIMHYRKDIFEKYGIKNPPDTWEEFRKVADKIHSNEVAAVGMRTSKNRGGVGFYFPQILESFGGSIVKDYPNDMRPNLLAPESIEAVEYFRDIVNNYGYPGMASAHYQDQVINFQQGRVAMMVEGNVISGQLQNPNESTVAGKIGFALIPKGPANRTSAGVIHALGIPTNSQNKELGYKFIEWALSYDIQKRNAIENITSSVTRPEIMLEPEFVELFGWGEGQWAKIVSETIANYSNPYYRPMNSAWPQVDEVFSTAMSSIVSNQEDVVPALKKANKQITEIYKKTGFLTE